MTEVRAFVATLNEPWERRRLLALGLGKTNANHYKNITTPFPRQKAVEL